ncbi:MAG: hypothetical protein ABGY42_03930 [bacterium]
MASDDLILAPENLMTLMQGLDGLGPALGPEAAANLGRVREAIETALAAQADGRKPDAYAAITRAMRELVKLATKMDPAEAALMQAVAGQFEMALQQGDKAHAAASVDRMREHSGARKRRPDDTEL